MYWWHQSKPFKLPDIHIHTYTRYRNRYSTAFPLNDSWLEKRAAIESCMGRDRTRLSAFFFKQRSSTRMSTRCLCVQAEADACELSLGVSLGVRWCESTYESRCESRYESWCELGVSRVWFVCDSFRCSWTRLGVLIKFLDSLSTCSTSC